MPDRGFAIFLTSARLLEGRFLDLRDGMDASPVVVVNETLARQYWPNDSSLGKRIDTGTGDGNPKWMSIVGVVRDVRERGLDLATKGAVYVPFTQTTIGFFQPSEIAVRTSRDPMSLSKELQNAVWLADREQPVSNIATMESIVDSEFAHRTQVLQLLGAFAALAIALAAVGVYGVLSYVVSLRAREIGLRMAIGATPSEIVGEMFFYSSKRIAAGIIIDILVSIGATRLLSTLLFGISALDLATFSAVSAGLVMVSLLASWIPLIRASRVDPMKALRAD
jgi:putative ABC transport system permease protein